MVEVGVGQRMQVEYVSANPTGPLHMGSARNAVLGDALANVLANAGYAVQREYYVNDAGSRMRAFQETLWARYQQALGLEAAVPEDGYHGPYMVDQGKELAARYGATLLDLPRAEALLEIGRQGVARVVEGARDDLAAMGITYDCWFSEQTLYDEGQFDAIMSICVRVAI
jgi:arginyl-tRNA synthetase